MIIKFVMCYCSWIFALKHVSMLLFHKTFQVYLLFFSIYSSFCCFSCFDLFSLTLASLVVPSIISCVNPFTTVDIVLYTIYHHFISCMLVIFSLNIYASCMQKIVTSYSKYFCNSTLFALIYSLLICINLLGTLV